MYFIFNNLKVVKDNFLIDFSLMQLMLLVISTKYYYVILESRVCNYFNTYKDSKKDAQKFLTMMRVLINSRLKPKTSFEYL